MSDVVFVLGAGASSEAGAPLMNDFLDTADRLYWQDPSGDAAEHYERVFRGIGFLQQAHSEAKLDIVNLESVFAAFDMAQLIDRLPGMEAEEIPRLTESLSVVIADTLERTVSFPIGSGPSGDRYVRAPASVFALGRAATQAS